MQTSNQRTKVRYPIDAILAVFGAWFLFAVITLVGFSVIALAAPFAVFFVGHLLAYNGLVTAAHEYAKRRGRVIVVPAPAEARAMTKLREQDLALGRS